MAGNLDLSWSTILAGYTLEDAKTYGRTATVPARSYINFGVSSFALTELFPYDSAGGSLRNALHLTSGISRRSTWGSGRRSCGTATVSALIHLF